MYCHSMYGQVYSIRCYAVVSAISELSLLLAFVVNEEVVTFKHTLTHRHTTDVRGASSNQLLSDL